MKRRRRHSSALAALAFLAPSLIGLSVFVLAPFADAIRRSFMDAMARNFVGGANYAAVWNNQAFNMAAVNTLKFVGVCIPLLLVTSLAIALGMRSASRATGLFGATFLLPLAIPVASVALIWQLMFAEKGLLSSALNVFGLAGADWLNTDSAFWVLVLSYVWRNAGYDMVLWRAGLSGIDPSLYEAAQMDGAGAWQRLRHITLPCIMPTFYTIAVLSLLNSFKVFREAYLIAGNYPHNSIYMLQHLFNNWFTSLDVQKLCAAAVMVAIVILALILLLQKLWPAASAKGGGQ